MNNLFKSMKFWELLFIIASLILISPLFIEFLLLSIIPLGLFSILPSILAYKERKLYIIGLNILILIGSFALYLYLW